VGRSPRPSGHSAGGSPQLPSYWKGGRVLAGAAAGVVSCAARQRVRPSERGRTDANPGGPALRCWCTTTGPPAICAPQARERGAGGRRRGEQGPREGERGLLAAPRVLQRAAKTEPPCRGSREDECRLDNSLLAGLNSLPILAFCTMPRGKKGDKGDKMLAKGGTGTRRCREGRQGTDGPRRWRLENRETSKRGQQQRR
jgi:hypothetical protein